MKKTNCIFVFWYPFLSYHQIDMLYSFNKKVKSNIKINVFMENNEGRLHQGWKFPNFFSVKPKLISGFFWPLYTIHQAYTHRNDVHILGSPFESIKTLFLFIVLGLLKVDTSLLAERYSQFSVGYLSDKFSFFNILKSKLRPVIYKFYGLLIRRFHFKVFAISRLAVLQYLSVGVSKNLIYQFGYYVNSYPFGVQKLKSEYKKNKLIVRDKKILSLVFLGSLIKTKNLDLLITAVKQLNLDGIAIRLDIYGAGDAYQYDFDNKKISYKGLINFGYSHEVLMNYDALILPSLYDGWGVVVNEAILANLPVIVSSNCGSKDLVQQLKCGYIFRSGSLSDLMSKIRLIKNRKKLQELRRNIGKFKDRISPAKAAEFLHLSIINDRT
jgi:glycosyltransferase involved in cell wall biosynthesis